MAQPYVIILDTEPGQQLGTQLQEILGDDSHYHVELQERLRDGRGTDGQPMPQLIIPVLSASPARDTRLLASCHTAAAHVPVLPVVPAAQLPVVLDHLGRALVDFLMPPFHAAEVHARVRRCLIGWQLRAQNDSTEAEPEALKGLISQDAAFAQVKRQLPRMAQFEAPVLLTGETGTGKELCARALHDLSQRAAGPFIPVNCGALPETLLTRELFGHHRGAFTGADASQSGLVAEAEGGTLFLDEIATLNLQAQAMLLRFLQDQSYYALGSPRPRQADVRIIAAANVDLADKVKDGSFRADLYYRLAVMPLSLPPLRERPGDIPLLATAFTEQFATQHELHVPSWSPEALAALCQYDWPGNVRELANVVQQALFASDGPSIEPTALPISPASTVPSTQGMSMQQAKARAIEQFERTYLTNLLRAHQGNISQAAQAAQKERHNFRRLLQKYRITPSDLS